MLACSDNFVNDLWYGGSSISALLASSKHVRKSYSGTTTCNRLSLVNSAMSIELKSSSSYSSIESCRFVFNASNWISIILSWVSGTVSSDKSTSPKCNWIYSLRLVSKYCSSMALLLTSIQLATVYTGCMLLDTSLVFSTWLFIRNWYFFSTLVRE